MEYASIFAALGLSRQVEKAVSCVTGSDAEKLIAGLLLAQTGEYEEHQFTAADSSAWEFNTFPGANGTLAAAGPVADNAVTWTLEYFLHDHWEPFDTQPSAGFFDIRVQWPTELARLTPNAVVDHIDVAKVG